MQTSIRAKAAGLTTSASWLANFMIGQVSPKAWEGIGWRYYLVFTVCSFTNALFFYFFFPETKGRTLEVSPVTKSTGINSAGNGRVPQDDEPHCASCQGREDRRPHSRAGVCSG